MPVIETVDGLALDFTSDLATLAESKRNSEERNGYEDFRRIRPELSFEEYRALSSSQRAKIILEAQPRPIPQDVPQDLGASEVPQEVKNSRSKETKKTDLGAPHLPQDLGASSEEKTAEVSIPSGRSRPSEFLGSRGTQKTGVMQEMLTAYERGEIEPEPIEMTLPRYLGKYARAVAEDMRLLFGLKRARCDEFPLPYAQSFGADRLGIGRDDVKRARAQLVRAGVIEEAGTLPILDRRRGVQFGNATKLYRLPDMEATSA